MAMPLSPLYDPTSEMSMVAISQAVLSQLQRNQQELQDLKDIILHLAVGIRQGEHSSRWEECQAMIESKLREMPAAGEPQCEIPAPTEFMELLAAGAEHTQESDQESGAETQTCHLPNQRPQDLTQCDPDIFHGLRFPEPLVVQARRENQLVCKISTVNDSSRYQQDKEPDKDLVASADRMEAHPSSLTIQYLSKLEACPCWLTLDCWVLFMVPEDLMLGMPWAYSWVPDQGLQGSFHWLEAVEVNGASRKQLQVADSQVVVMCKDWVKLCCGLTAGYPCEPCICLCAPPSGYVYCWVSFAAMENITTRMPRIQGRFPDLSLEEPFYLADAIEALEGWPPTHSWALV
ncbi:uncharacterized protein LOC105942543 isoform X2 [Ochotona princeps]|uniref:uncharacterized protein LOC105942543 isoform X2 n=1 Tax=Ochotona princeps TaxID=9978 RepID=UPI0027154B37|nr:uncharacterized protein LOC105942543 isoform X2 [Ochotona princeps]